MNDFDWETKAELLGIELEAIRQELDEINKKLDEVGKKYGINE